MHGLSLAPLAVLFELDFALNKLFVFGAPIVDALALLAGEFYQTILGHSPNTLPHRARLCNLLLFGICMDYLYVGVRRSFGRDTCWHRVFVALVRARGGGATVIRTLICLAA